MILIAILAIGVILSIIYALRTFNSLCPDLISCDEGADVNNKEYEIIPHKDEPIVHKLSHQHLYTKFYIVKLNTALHSDVGQKKISFKDVHSYPVPILLGNFIEAFFK